MDPTQLVKLSRRHSPRRRPTKSTCPNPYSEVIGYTGYTQYRDATTQAPWMYNGSTFWTFDDPTELAFKTQYANGKGLLGHMVWNLMGDTSSSSLLKAICGAMTSTDPFLYNFESGTQSWTMSGAITSVSASKSVAFAGQNSLAAAFSSSTVTTKSQVYVRTPSLQPGTVVQYHVWIPANSSITAVNPFVEDHNYLWSGDWQSISALRTNAWNTLSVTVPLKAATPLSRVGIEFTRLRRRGAAQHLSMPGRGNPVKSKNGC